MMSLSLRRRLRIALVGVLLGLAFGALYAVVLGGHELEAMGEGALTGGLIAAGIGFIEAMRAQSRARRLLRRLPFVVFVVVRTAVWVAWIMLSLVAVPWLLHGAAPHAIGAYTVVIAYSVAVALSVVAVLELNRLLGGGTLRKLITGRYHQPRIEERAFLLLDLVGSTAMAERLGDTRFLALLDRLICDIGEDIAAYRGEIYRYVGDAIITSWPLAAATRDAAIVRCLFAVERRMARERADYQREFDVAPSLRAVLHAGPIAIGEVGDSRREITFLGDTLNTAARLEKMCGDLGCRAVISQTLLDRLTLPPGVAVAALGKIVLAGKLQPVSLHSLTVADVLHANHRDVG